MALRGSGSVRGMWMIRKVDSPQWLHLLLRAKRILNSLLHFLQVGSDLVGSGGEPLRSGRPLRVFMVECGQEWCGTAAVRQELTKHLIGARTRVMAGLAVLGGCEPRSAFTVSS